LKKKDADKAQTSVQITKHRLVYKLQTTKLLPFTIGFTTHYRLEVPPPMDSSSPPAAAARCLAGTVVEVVFVGGLLLLTLTLDSGEPTRISCAGPQPPVNGWEKKQSVDGRTAEATRGEAWESWACPSRERVKR
jgi:hypothetical protein